MTKHPVSLAAAFTQLFVCISALAQEPVVQIDHIIWAVPNLDAGAAYLEELSGVEPATGGVHPGRGTRNKLVGAGNNIYVEVIAPDPAQMPFDPVANPVQAFADRISKMDGPEVDMFAYASSDLEWMAEAGRRLGLEVVGPTPGQRRTPEGKLIRWSHVDFINHGFGQFIPFAINWLDSPHPATTSPEGAVIVKVTVHHPRADELRRIYEGLSIPAEVVYGDEPVIVVELEGKKGAFELRSGQSLFDYYDARSDDNI